MATCFGPLMVLTFCLSQAFRDVYFAAVFQGVDFFVVIVIAFGLSVLIFGALAALRRPAEFAILRRQGATVAAMNLTTAIAWTCYFFALQHLEPSIVNAVHSGMAPLTVIALGACGAPLAKPAPVGRLEYAFYGGMALSLAGLWWVVLSGASGEAGASFAARLLGLALLLASGSSITVSLLYSKRLHDKGVGAEAVTAVRYLLIVALAASVAAWKHGLGNLGSAGELSLIAVAATALIVLPTFALQLGIAHTAPLTAQVMRSLGPVCVFALEQFDGRTSYSAPVLAGIALYSVFAIGGNLAHAWQSRGPAMALASAARPSGSGRGPLLNTAPRS